MTPREEAERRLLDVIHRHLDERRDGMKLELLESGISEADHDQFLDEFKLEMETKILKEFHKKVIQRAKQDASERMPKTHESVH